MKFEYLARTKKGETQAGTIEAPNESAALKTLQDHNLIVVQLRSSGKGFLLTRKIKIFERIKRKEIFVFFRQLAILVEADVPLVQSLKVLTRQIQTSRFKEIIFEVTQDVDGGSSFSKALAKYPRVFSTFTINLIKTGEVSGRLQESLSYLADYLEKQYYLISKIRGAMIYPAFILLVFLVAGSLVMVMVVPSLTSILLETGQELPLPTRILIASSNFARSWGWIFFLLFILALPLVFRYSRTPSGRSVFDRIKLKLPLFGPIFQKIYLARLSDTLGVLIKGGVSVLQSLNIAGEVVGNVVFRRIIFRARDEVKAGRSISAVLEEHSEIPPMFYQMTRTGEKTGKLDTILEKLSKFYNREVESVVDNLSQLIEPVLIIVLAVGVALLVFAVFMPIYNMVGAF